MNRCRASMSRRSPAGLPDRSMWTLSRPPGPAWWTIMRCCAPPFSGTSSNRPCPRCSAPPTPVGLARTAGPSAAADRYAVHDHELPVALPDVAAFARRHRLTVNTLVQGAWALLLARYGGSDDVVFGVTVAGRPAELEVERTVGLFINTLPLRIAVTPAQPVVHWLLDLQARQTELLEHQYAPLSEVQRWSEVPAGTPLFDSIVAFENYPVELSAMTAASQTIRIADVQAVERTNYPLTLQVAVGQTLWLKLIYD